MNPTARKICPTTRTGEQLVAEGGNKFIYGCRNFVPTEWNAQVEKLIDLYWLDFQNRGISLEGRKSGTRDVVAILNQCKDQGTFWDKDDGPRDTRGKLNALGVKTWKGFTFRQLTTDKELKAKMRFPMETGLNRIRNSARIGAPPPPLTVANPGPMELSSPPTPPISGAKRAPSPTQTLHVDNSWMSTLPESNLHEVDEENGEPGISEPLYGRDRETAELESALAARGSMVSLVGRSGVGKTHLARRFAWDWFCNSGTDMQRFGFWVNAANESTLRESYEDVLRRIRRYGLYEPNQRKRKPRSIGDLANLLWEALSEFNQFEWILASSSASSPKSNRKTLDSSLYIPVELENGCSEERCTIESDDPLLTNAVRRHYLEHFGHRDLDGMVSDYCPDACLVNVVNGKRSKHRGHEEIRACFSERFSQHPTIDSSFQLKHITIEARHAHVVWVAQTPKTVFPQATDAFVFDIHGKIIKQHFSCEMNEKKNVPWYV